MLSFWMKYLLDPNYDQRSALRSQLVMAGRVLAPTAARGGKAARQRRVGLGRKMGFCDRVPRAVQIGLAELECHSSACHPAPSESTPLSVAVRSLLRVALRLSIAHSLLSACPSVRHRCAERAGGGGGAKQ